MPPVFQEALAVAGSFSGIASLLTVILLSFKTKADMKMSFLQFAQSQEEAKLGGAQADRKIDNEEEGQNYSQLKTLYDIAISQRDFYMAEARLHKTEAEAMRVIWATFDLNFEDVVDLAAAEQKRRRERKPV